MKCNPDPEVIATLALLGANFDCASKHEIEVVLEIGKKIKYKLGNQNLGIGPDRIGFFHPCKMRSHLQYSKEVGIQKMVFDSLNELDKIADVYYGSKYVAVNLHC